MFFLINGTLSLACVIGAIAILVRYIKGYDGTGVPEEAVEDCDKSNRTASPDTITEDYRKTHLDDIRSKTDYLYGRIPPNSIKTNYCIYEDPTTETQFWVPEYTGYKVAVQTAEELTGIYAPIVDAMAFLMIVNRNVDESIYYEKEIVEQWEREHGRHPTNNCQDLFREQNIWERLRSIADRSRSGFLNYPEDLVNHSKKVAPTYEQREKIRTEMFDKSEKY